jgi:hypothetical protein
MFNSQKYRIRTNNNKLEKRRKTEKLFALNAIIVADKIKKTPKLNLIGAQLLSTT